MSLSTGLVRIFTFVVFTSPVFAVQLGMGSECPDREAVSESTTPQDVWPDGWMAIVEDQVRLGEYRYSEAGEGQFSAPNRAQALRSSVGPSGIVVVPRGVTTSEESPWQLEMSTVAFGWVEAPAQIGEGTIGVDGASVYIQRKGLTEWFTNDERGIEQFWTVSEPPLGPSMDVLWIGLRIVGLSARIYEDGTGAALVDSRGMQRARYVGLKAFDANGADLPAKLRVGPSGIGIQVEVSQAVYPITIDPVLTGPIWFDESDQANASFGRTVAPAGDVNGDGYGDILVGAFRFDNGQADEGRAYLYLGSASGPLNEPAWTAEGDQIGASFGWSLASAGDINGDGYDDVVVGAYLYDNGETDEGRAQLYLGSSAGLQASPSWIYESNQANAQFGYSVAGAGDVNGDGFADIVIGANLFDNGILQDDEGRAFLFLGGPSGLSNLPDWTAESNQAGAQFGWSVASAGDVNADGLSDVIVGAPTWDNQQANEGSAFLYFGSEFFGLSATPAWSDELDNGDDQMGYVVAGVGDVNGDGFSDVLVSAPFFSVAPTLDNGRIVLYYGSPTGLPGSPSWELFGVNTSQEWDLGKSLNAAGDVNGDGFADFVVGAPHPEALWVRLYLGSATGPVLSDTLTGIADGFACSGAGDVNGDGYSDVIIGNNLASNGQAGEGRAYVYLGGPVGITAPSVAAARSFSFGTLNDERSGYSVCTAGDVNGDGYSDWLLGAPQYDGGELDEGRVMLFLGPSSGAAVPAWTLEGNQPGARLGSCVASAGDVDADGLVDIAFTAPGWDDAGIGVDAGRAYVYRSIGNGSFVELHSWIGSNANDQLSFVCGVGDVNGDGLGDVAWGSPLCDVSALQDAGEVKIWLGSVTSPPFELDATLEGVQSGEMLGGSIAHAGDVNSDGFSDVVIGAPGWSNGQANEGGLFLYLGGQDGMTAGPGLVFESGFAQALLGYSVASAGDVNGDGHADVIAGAPGYHNGQFEEGWAFVFYGTGVGVTATPVWAAEGNQVSAKFGSSVSSAGDVNADGYADVIVGAPLYDGTLVDGGRASVFHGSASGLSTTAAWIIDAGGVLEPNGQLLGSSVSSAGDVNGDGYGDVLVGAPGATIVLAVGDEGASYLFLGGGAGSGAKRPLQFRQNNSAPVALLGTSESASGFRIQLNPWALAGFAGTPMGMADVRLEWEVKPTGMPFSGTEIERGTNWVSTGPVGFQLTLNEIVNGLQQGQAYHWRARVAQRNPFFPHSPWVNLAGNAPTETKIRTLRLPDTTPPTLFCPSSVWRRDEKPLISSGEIVVFEVTAMDDQDPTPSITCIPASGSFFPRGTTMVTCTAVDASGNQSTCMFPIVVAPTIQERRP